MATAEREQDDDQLWQMLKALGNPVRLQIVRFIRQHPNCICNEILLQLPDNCSRAQSTLSQHLKILRDANLICAETDSHMTYYTLNHGQFEWLCAQLAVLNNLAELEAHTQLGYTDIRRRSA